ncbi:LUD domain-containing protein [Clostridium sp. AF50-3]|uniref:LUD domain-containing protein n=1 Tax=Clostridium sp. AF50-3 TaxID=2293021 RepID=UPI002541142D|nr:LUD domain-containing protein [Clostridium sp. AF50-3]
MEQELLKNNFERHGFKTSFFDTKKAASDYLKDQISGKKVAIGGSVTAQEMGLYEALSEKNEVIWHWKKAGREMLVEARSAEVYITSANGVSKTGELVNIDGTGNRVSQTYSDRKKYILSLETIKSVRI